MFCFSGGKLASLDEFKVKREDLMAQTAKLESLLAEREEQHREAIYNLEKKQVIDKDRSVYSDLP